MARTILIGSTGFLGSALLDHLPHDSVVPVPRLVADLRQPASLRSVISHGDVIINAAGYADVTDRSRAGIRSFQSVNVDGLRNLVEAAIAQRASQLIHISSVAAQGRLTGYADESSRGPITTPYAASKRRGEQLLARRADELPVTVLRPTSVFGEARGLTATLCRVSKMRIVPLPDGGDARVPFTYVGNVAHAVQLAVANRDCFGKTFIIGDRSSYPMRDFVGNLGEHLGRRPMIFSVSPALMRLALLPLEMVRVIGRRPVIDSPRWETLTVSIDYSIEAFCRATGYEPPYTLDAALRAIASGYHKGRRDT